MTKFQIRDESFGLALYEAESARDALYLFFADRVKGQLRPIIREDGDRASVVVDGMTYTAVSG